MTGTEERLRAALAAKADTVTRAGLRRPELPARGRAGHRLRTAALFTLAAALIGAALLLPAALTHGPDREPATRPRPTASQPGPTPRTRPVPGAAPVPARTASPPAGPPVAPDKAP